MRSLSIDGEHPRTAHQRTGVVLCDLHDAAHKPSVRRVPRRMIWLVACIITVVSATKQTLNSCVETAELNGAEII